MFVNEQHSALYADMCNIMHFGNILKKWQNNSMLDTEVQGERIIYEPSLESSSSSLYFRLRLGLAKIFLIF